MLEGTLKETQIYEEHICTVYCTGRVYTYKSVVETATRAAIGNAAHTMRIIIYTCFYHHLPGARDKQTS